MADLSGLNSSGSTKIAGASSTGIETGYVNSTLNGDLQTADRANSVGVEGAITVGTSAVAARVGGSNLSERKTLTVYNNSNSTIYWGYTSGVTTSTGTPIVKGQQGSWTSIGPNITVYLISSSTGNDIRITESA